MTVSAHPLQWPAGRPRTPHYNLENAKFDVTFARARDNIIAEVKLLTGGRWGTDPLTVISTNIALRSDGLPLARQRAPDDIGVAVYFTYKKRQMSFACDRWLKIEHNMQAIAKTIEALRGIARWGTGDMLEAAFRGFTALPAPTAKREWREVLDLLYANHITTSQLRDSFRRAAAIAHPDRAGGSHDAMTAVNAAYEEAKKALGFE
ncbi:MAG: molecular chaperone DnaJ [Rhodocyclales bacterium]|nr:molecular chaperone DnaJ [Rhodocyclales bacterium]